MAKQFIEYKKIYINDTGNNPRNHVKYDKLTQLHDDFLAGRRKEKRLGQAFMNELDTSITPFHQLYYEESTERAMELIWENYKIWNDKHNTVADS